MSTMTLEQAMRRAFSLGQTYWQQADSESYAQNKKADGTAERFDALLHETLDAHLAQPAQAVDVGAIREVIEQMGKASLRRAMPPYYDAGCYGAWIGQLTRALSGEKAGPVADGPRPETKFFLVSGTNRAETPILLFTSRAFADQYCRQYPRPPGYYKLYAASPTPDKEG